MNYEGNAIMDWDDEINEENSDFVIIPESDYRFTVTGFERGNFEGSDKLPACKKAIVTFTIHAPEGDVIIKDNFLLCRKMEWKISALFLAVGMKKHDEPLRMNWTALIRQTGFCRVYIDTYIKKDGSQGQSNKIKKFYAYDEQPEELRTPAAVQYVQPANPYPQTGWTPGNF